ncbi:MAG: hypothetical protein IAE82_05610, partial [Opitutaceae bacterium]|nr:hypothetical protein [Opitutaceae bacterium]
KIYRKIRARRLWDLIMASTYDYAEPGFILIDEVNEMNNNWFCENIRASNPCVTADTRLHTQYGLIPIGELYEKNLPLEVSVDQRALGLNTRGIEQRPAIPAFMTAVDAEVYCVLTKEGYEIKATAWHDFYTTRGKIKLKDLQLGDKLLVQSGKGQFGNQGSAELGQLIGLITGDGHFTKRSDNQDIVVISLWGEDRHLAEETTAYINNLISTIAKTNRHYKVSPVTVPARNMITIGSALLARLLEDEYGFTARTKYRVPEVIWRGTEACVKGYLCSLFQMDGTVNVSSNRQSCSVRLASSHRELLKDVQLLLTNFGIFSRIYQRRDAEQRRLPDGKGGYKLYNCQADYELIIDGESRNYFIREIGFYGNSKNQLYWDWAKNQALKKTQSFATKVIDISYVGREPVFDTTQPDHNTVIFNGLVTGQCGEQMLPPYGSCLLGSVNLTPFVQNPFTDRARFLDLLKALPELQEKMGAANEAQGLAVDVTFGEIQDYHGASLVDYSQTYRALTPAMEEALTALRTMGIETFTATYAITSDQVLYAMGDNSRARAEALVDAKSVPAAAVTPATYGLPTDATIFTAISLPRYLAWISNIAPMPFAASAPLPADLKPGLAMTADLNAGRADLRLHLAASEVAAVVGMTRPQASAPAALPVVE